MTHSRLDEVRNHETDAAKTDHRIAIEVSEDHLQAWIQKQRMVARKYLGQAAHYVMVL